MADKQSDPYAYFIEEGALVRLMPGRYLPELWLPISKKWVYTDQVDMVTKARTLPRELAVTEAGGEENLALPCSGWEQDGDGTGAAPSPALPQGAKPVKGENSAVASSAASGVSE